MADGAVRDMSGRRFPAHLDTRYGDEAWWHGPERYSRVQPWYTFDRERTIRDWYRARTGTPDDHQLPRPGDSPEERREARRAAARERRLAEVARLRLEGRIPERVEFECTCPPRVRGARRPLRQARARAGLRMSLRRGLTRCYRGRVRGSLLLTRRGEALS